MIFKQTYKLKTVLLTGLIAIIVLGNFPGYMTLDSTSQLHQARTMILNDGHPPAMALIWSLLDKIVPGPVLMLFLNAIIHVWGVWLMSAIFVAPRKRYWLTALTILFIPTYFTIGVIWKDTLMNGFLLLAAGGIVQLVLGAIFKENLFSSLRWLLLIVVALFLAISQRHNAPAGAVVLLCPVVLVFLNRLRKQKHVKSVAGQDDAITSALDLNWWKILITALLSVVTVIVLFLSSVSFFDRFVTHHRNFWQVLAFYDLAAISTQIDENILPADIYPEADLELLKKHYSPYSVLSLTKYSGFFYYITDEAALEKLSAAWKGAIMEHPTAYFSHRKSIYSEALGTGGVHPWAPIIVEPTIESRKHLYMPEVATFQKPLRTKLKNYVVRQDPFFYAPWFYYYLGLALILFFLIKWGVTRRISVKESLLLCFLTSGIAYELSLFFVAPSPDFRYSSYMIFMSAFCILAVILDVPLGSLAKARLKRTGNV